MLSPTITSFTPTSGGTRTVVTIAGTNFIGTTAVVFGGMTAASFTVINASTIRATVGSGATGTVSVTTPAGTATSTGVFTYYPMPTITSFTPTSGCTGTVVTITGTNFTGATAVTFGGQDAPSFTVVSATSITATVGIGGSGAITVIAPGGTAISSSNFTFTGPAKYGDWWMFHHDPQHTGRSPFIGPTFPVQQWAFSTGYAIGSSPAIGVDGTIYLGSGNGILYAINSDSTQKWTFPTGSAIQSSPAIGVDGTIYIGSDDNNLYALNPDGTQQWVFPTGNWINSSPALGADGTIYVGSEDNNLYALNPDGTQQWVFPTGSYIYSSPAIGSDGNIYVGSGDANLYALNPDGTQKWAFPTGWYIYSSPAIGSDGTIYVGSGDANLYALNPDGTLQWAFPTKGAIQSSPALGADGTIYVGSSDNNFYAINPNGTEQWAFATFSGIQSSPAIGADGTIYVGSNDNNLYALNPDGTEQWAFSTGKWITSSPAIGADGTIYAGSYDGKLYAIAQGGPSIALHFGMQPGATLVGASINPPVTVLVQDTAGHTEITSAVPVTLALGANPGNATLAGTLTVNAVQGVATFSNLTLDQVGSGYTLSATAPGLTGATSQPFSVYLVPTITSFTPTSGDTGTIVTISGTNFTGATAVAFGGLYASSFTVVSATSITATVGLGFSGTVTVTTPGGTATSSSPFTFTGGDKRGVWWMFHHDLQHTGRSPFTGPASPVQFWAFPTNDVIWSSPAIGANGTIYIGSDDGNLYALNPNGTQKWVFPTKSCIVSSPALGGDGTIYVGSDDSNLYAINPDGTQQWAFTTGNCVDSSPAIGADGTIYVGSLDANLYAINPNGTEQWAFPVGRGIFIPSPALAADGTIYVGSWDDNLYAINPDGTLQWAFATGDGIYSSPALGADGTIYVGSEDANLYAINPDGTQKWVYSTNNAITSSPALGADGTIYVGSDDNHLYAVNPDGTQKWALATGSNVESSPVIGADGTIYVGSDDNNLYAINPDGTQKWALATLGWITSSPALGADGTIYVGSFDEHLYAICDSASTIRSTITSFTPTSGVTGTLVTITGTNFTGATAVAFCGMPALGFTVDSDTQITALVGAGAPTGAVGPITVTTPVDTATSTTNFTYLPAACTGVIELAKDFLPITSDQECMGAGADAGDVFQLPGATGTEPWPTYPNGAWSWMVEQDNSVGLWAWFGAGVYNDTTPVSLNLLSSPYYYPNWGTYQPQGVVALERTLPAHAAYNDPSTAENGLAYRNWSVNCAMMLDNWCNMSGNGRTADPYWEIDDINGTPLAKLEFQLDTNGNPLLVFNGTAFTNQPVPTTIQATFDCVTNIVVVPGFSKAGDHAYYTPLNLTITGADNGTVSALIVDADGNVYSANATTSGDNRYPALLTIESGNAATIGGTGYQIYDTTSGCLLWYYLSEGQPGTPTITSYTPTSGGTGTVVTITGANFTGTTAVAFGGTSAQSFTVVDDTTISATVGSGASGYLTVTTPSATVGNAVIFTYTLPLTALALSATPASPQPANIPITFTAAATGGSDVSYQFWLYNSAANPAWCQMQGYSSSATCCWTPTAPGNYLISATAQDGVSGAVVNTLAWYTINGPLTAVSVTPSPASPQPPNTPITFTATATGGSNVQFQYWLYNPAANPAWSQMQGYSSSATCLWTPTAVGNYVISVTALDATGTAVNTLLPYTISGPLTAINVTSSLASPQPPNTPITFTATATGGTNVQFQYWLYNPAANPAWSQLQSYSSSATYQWTPATPGNYVISVTALDTTGAGVNTMLSYTIGSPLTAVNVTPSLASPQPVNTPITFTATATGGSSVQFQYWLYNPAANPAWTQLQDYSSLATYQWTPTTPGNYVIAVTALDATGTAVNTLFSYSISGPLTTVSVTPSLASPQPVDTSITFTAMATGGSNVQYQYWLYNPEANPAWSQLQAYTSIATYQWIPAAPGNYVISVTALDATGTAVNTLLSYTIVTPLTAVNVTPSLASPQPPNTPITFTATATGGTNVQYQFWVYNPNFNPAWNQLQTYSTQPTCTWTPTSPGSYLLSVTAQDGVTGTAVNTLLWFTEQ